MKPTIGVVPLWDSEKTSLWMIPGYMGGIEQAGGIPLMLPLTTDREVLGQLVSTLDGFLLTGGQDVSPELYGSPKSPLCGECSPELDEMESSLFQMARALDKPMLGICRGIQFVNAVMGGTLYQDLPTEHPSPVEHHMSPPYDGIAHRVTIVPASPLGTLLDAGTIGVNSKHHQAVRDLAPGLEVMAVSEDGLIEAVRDPSQTFLWALQWHPELSYPVDENSRKIFSAFVHSCVRR